MNVVLITDVLAMQSLKEQTIFSHAPLVQSSYFIWYSMTSHFRLDGSCTIGANRSKEAEQNFFLQTNSDACDEW